MKHLAVVICLLYAPTLLAQYSHSRQHNSFWEARKLVLGVILSPAITGPTQQAEQAIYESSRYREEAKPSLAWGIQARYRLSEQWEAQLRLMRIDKGYKHILVGPVTMADHPPTNYRMFFISLPASLRYNLKRSDKFTLYVFAGMAPEFLSRTAGLRYEDHHYPVSLSYLAGAGGEFPLKDHWFVNIEPTFTNNLTPLNRLRGYKPLSLGLAVGLFYDYRPAYTSPGQ